MAHDGIDTDREAITACYNEIAESTSSALEFQLHKLRGLLANHFQNEDSLLRQAGSGLCNSTARDHRLFLDLCDQAIKVSRETKNPLRRLILRELLPALREHIAYRDQLIALHLRSLGAGASHSSRLRKP